MSGMPFQLDTVETGEQWVVTCTTPHGKAVSRIPAPFSTEPLQCFAVRLPRAPALWFVGVCLALWPPRRPYASLGRDIGAFPH